MFDKSKREREIQTKITRTVKSYFIFHLDNMLDHSPLPVKHFFTNKHFLTVKSVLKATSFRSVDTVKNKILDVLNKIAERITSSMLRE